MASVTSSVDSSVFLAMLRKSFIGFSMSKDITLHRVAICIIAGRHALSLKSSDLYALSYISKYETSYELHYKGLGRVT